MPLPVSVPTSSDPSPIVTRHGAALWLHRTIGVGQILGVGLLVPLAILAVGAPIVLVVRALIALAERLS